MIEKYIPRKAVITDLGSGEGIFSIWMSLTSNERDITGVDRIQERIDSFQDVCRYNRVKVNPVSADIRDFKISKSDVITLIDVLYLMPLEEQERLLKKCFEALNPGGLLVIKEMDYRPFYKFSWCFIQELIVTKLFKNNLTTGLYFRSKNSLTGVLKGFGLDTRSMTLDKSYFYPHILYLCGKKYGENYIN